jgi:hypothetical protein
MAKQLEWEWLNHLTGEWNAIVDDAGPDFDAGAYRVNGVPLVDVLDGLAKREQGEADNAAYRQKRGPNLGPSRGAKEDAEDYASMTKQLDDWAAKTALNAAVLRALAGRDSDEQ